MPFQAKPFYNLDDDSVTVFFAEDESYREYVNPQLVLYKSLKTHEIVGCRICGVLKHKVSTAF
jgi:hypothetical protein